MATSCCQVIDGDGEFQEQQLEQFVRDAGVVDARTNYQVVAIMGPQSSGKSTLMNHLFGTKFQEMDAMTGRQQTTKGVWLARSPKLEETCTLIMDLEGADGRERGEDDTNFERQSALFALAVADVLLINVWCHDIGREQGSGKPLMKTIFQVNLKLFAPEPNRRRTVLLFVIRDKSRTPLSKLAEILGEDVTRMWDSISKPPQYEDSRIEDFFEVQYTALPHYEDKYEDFLADAVVLRRRFTADGDDSLVRASPDKLPADSLVLSTRNIWGIIRSQKDLNLPAHKVMVANIRCNEIKLEQIRNFSADQAWAAIAGAAGSELIRDFGLRVAQLLDSCTQGYEVEAAYFDAGVRAEHREDLAAKLAALAEPPFRAQLALLSAELLAAFGKDFRLALADGDQGFSDAARAAGRAALGAFDARSGELLVPGVPLAAGEARASLESQILEHVERAKHARVKEALHATEATLTKLIAVPAVELLATFPPNLWQQLHAVRGQAIATASSDLRSALSGVELREEERAALGAKLDAAAAKKLADLLQEAALTRVTRMRDVFNHAFSVDEHGTPRTWRPKDNIPQLAKAARRQAARVLALLAVVRPGDYAGGDAVEAAIMSMVRKDVDGEGGGGTSGGASAASSTSSSAASRPAGEGPGAPAGVPPGWELATATHWPGVAAADVLVAPHEARLAWREFMSASALSVQQAQVTQQANLMAGKRSAPVWALLAILFLGWNELMVVVFNPLYLIFGGLMFLFGWQMYSELDVDIEMQRGPMLGAMAIWNKLGDGLRSVLRQNVEMVGHLGGTLVEMVQQPHHNHHHEPAASHATLAAAADSVGGGDVLLRPAPAPAAPGSLSAPGLKQRPGAAAPVDSGGVQMTALRSAAHEDAENDFLGAEGKDA